jgi:hypothetical protein
MEIKFGMLQQLKSKSMGAQGANSASAKLNVSNAESVFKQYEKYKTQMAEAEQNGGETASNTAMPFGNTSMSVSELQSKMDECVEEFNKYIENALSCSGCLKSLEEIINNSLKLD